MDSTPPQTPGPVSYRQSSSSVQDFLTFRVMITPVIIQILFWIGVALSILGGLGMIIAGLAGGDVVIALVGLMYLVLGPVMVRIYCELLILFFRMHEALTEIRNNTAR